MKNVSKIYKFCKELSQKSYILILILNDLGVTLVEQTDNTQKTFNTYVTTHDLFNPSWSIGDFKDNCVQKQSISKGELMNLITDATLVETALLPPED